MPRMMLHFRPSTVHRNDECNRRILRDTKTLKWHPQLDEVPGRHLDLGTGPRDIAAAAGTCRHLCANAAAVRPDDDATSFRFEKVQTQLLIHADDVAHR